jgi:hypothetical protein
MRGSAFEPVDFFIGELFAGIVYIGILNNRVDWIEPLTEEKKKAATSASLFALYDGRLD